MKLDESNGTPMEVAPHLPPSSHSPAKQHSQCSVLLLLHPKKSPQRVVQSQPRG